MTGQLQPGRSRFPALDPEPPPGQRLRRRLVPAAIAVAALVALGLSIGLAGSSVSGSRAIALPGVPSSTRVVLLTAHGELATARVDGSGLVTMNSFGRFGNQAPEVSADGRYLVDRDGAIFSLSGGRVASVPTALHLGGREAVSLAGPFADHDRAVTVLVEGPYGSPTASAGLEVIPIATGQPISLGTADHAAGDPQSEGAFVAVPGQETGSSPASQTVPPDSAVELRDAGVPPVTLVTATQAAAAVGMDPSLPVVLYPFPDPNGDTIAIGVSPSDGGFSEGVVVVGRTGDVQGDIQAGIGPIPDSYISWSHDGTSLAFVGDSNGPEIATWTYERGLSVATTPRGDPGAGRCVWSTAGSSLLCSAAAVTPTRYEWYYSGSPAGPVVAVKAPGYALAWLPPGSDGSPSN